MAKSTDEYTKMAASQFAATSFNLSGVMVGLIYFVCILFSFSNFCLCYNVMVNKKCSRRVRPTWHAPVVVVVIA